MHLGAILRDRSQLARKDVAHAQSQAVEHTRRTRAVESAQGAAVKPFAVVVKDHDLLRTRIHEPVLADTVALVDRLLLSPILRGRLGREHLDDEVWNDAQYAFVARSRQLAER